MSSPAISFPHPGWAWPSESRQMLLRAALIPDQANAIAAFEQWLDRHDLDEIGFADHRLLAAIAERHGQRLAHLPDWPRVQGLQRQLWTRSRIRVHHILPTLQRLAGAGVELMLLKGAARIALRPDAQRQRAHQDVDILVRAAQMGEAARVLNAEGWQTVRGDSALAALGRAPAARAINFQRLPWGDIDLHRQAYHGKGYHQEFDKALWVRGQPASYFGLPVLVPEPAERLAMILSHGAWSPEEHSDWLLDAADILQIDAVDWDYFQKVVKLRRLQSHVRIGLSFLSQVAGIALPGVLQPLAEGRCDWGTLLIARDPRRLTPGLRRLRSACHAIARAQREPASRSTVPPLKIAFAKSSASGSGLNFAESYPLSFSESTGAPSYFEADIILPAPAGKRRIELELNNATENLARFRIFAFPSASGFIQAKLSVRLRKQFVSTELELVARPGKLMMPDAQAMQQAKYAKIPFACRKASLKAM